MNASSSESTNNHSDIRSKKNSPDGEVVIRAIPMPANTNVSGDIFGGWLVSQMDIGASVIAYKHARCRIATVAINRLQFIRPVQVGDSMSCYGKLIKVGNTSMTIMLEAWCRRLKNPDCEELVAEGEFVFVALDKDGNPCAVKKE